MNKKEKYIGSVRFFKHMILTTVGLMIAIPTAVSVFFGVRSGRLLSEKNALLSEKEVLQAQVDEWWNAHELNGWELVNGNEKYAVL